MLHFSHYTSLLINGINYCITSIGFCALLYINTGMQWNERWEGSGLNQKKMSVPIKVHFAKKWGAMEMSLNPPPQFRRLRVFYSTLGISILNHSNANLLLYFFYKNFTLKVENALIWNVGHAFVNVTASPPPLTPSDLLMWRRWGIHVRKV